MKKPFYFFNTKTLAFEKVEVSAKDIIKRIVWILLTALAFSVVFVWLSFYVVDSPSEKMLQKENNELKEKIQQMNNKLNMMEIVLLDIQERDDNVYRTIFETAPIPIEKRNPIFSYGQQSDTISMDETMKLLQHIETKSDKMILQLALQSRSLDTVMRLAENKSEMLAAIPAIRPIKNMNRIASGFGRRYHPILKVLRAHTGVDITAPRGTPVYATADGVISRENAGSGYGVNIVINHGFSYKTIYAHLSKKNVKPGQKVKRGQLIGYVGNTGLSSGPHLHYEVRKNDVPVNPVHFMFEDITPEEYNTILESSKEINQALS